ncbi:MAG: CvpA family protein [Candidatus Omnitrophica bacterium]|nr:CvpA family protein [Candidatus Omnitrophota bacterium]
MDIVNKLNWVDILVVIIMMRTIYVAFQDGLSHEIFPLLGAFSSLILSLAYYKKIAFIMSQNIGGVAVAILEALSFVTLFVAVIFVFKLLRLVFDKIINVTWHPFIEKFGGLLAGAIKASMITSAILIMLALLPLPYLKWSIGDRSFIGMYFLKIGPSIYAKVSRVLPFIKIDDASFNVEYVVRDIIEDNTRETKARKEVKEIPDWEKPFVKK